MSSGGRVPDHDDPEPEPGAAAEPARSPAPRPPTLIRFGRHGRHPGQFSIVLVFHRALETFRAAPFLIFGLALLVFAPISLLDAAVAEYSHHVDANVVGKTSSVAAQFFDLFVDLLGFAFFGGLLDHLVGRIHHGHEAHRPHELARRFSYGRLISASILFNLTVLVGIAFLILPGLVLFTIFTFVGPLINIEGVSVGAAFRRSFRISRRYLLGVACTVTVPFVIEQLADGWIEGLPFAHGLWGEFAVGLFMSLVGTAVVVMFEVCTAYHLLELEAERVGAPGPSH